MTEGPRLSRRRGRRFDLVFLFDLAADLEPRRARQRLVRGADLVHAARARRRPAGAVAALAPALAARRVCHCALVFVLTCSIAAVIVRTIEHVQWRWALNGRLAPGLRPTPVPGGDRDHVRVGLRPRVKVGGVLGAHLVVARVVADLR